MMFREKSTSKLYAFALAAVFALVLAGCGGGGGTAQTTEEEVMKTPEEIAAEMEAAARATCEGAGGRYNDDKTCTSAEELIQERIDEAVQAEKDRVAAEEAEQERIAAEKAMMATAMKLHKGISPPGGTGDATRTAAYDTDGNIEVTIGSATAVDLKEDKKATVADNHGWEGKKYTHTVTAAGITKGDTYEAMVYSNVEDPTPGDKFSEEYSDNLTNGVLNETTTEGTASRVASTRFDQSAGVKLFKLPDPNPSGETKINIPGKYHGVSGTYTCTPGSNTCAVQVAAKGFNLGGVTDAKDASTFGAGNAAWTFKPTNADNPVMSEPDAIYASYGWWIKKTADGKTFTASAFVSDKGDVPDAAGITALLGKATYMGGAAGKYALYSSTGGTNDAGHFTARATLEADFGDDMITGTIDQFMGADGKARNWSVELKKSGVNDTGTILGSDGTGDQMQTVWTIGGTAAAASGGWQGTLKDNGADGVPKVGTGTFYSTYSTSGKMVGAFGVNKQ